MAETYGPFSSGAGAAFDETQWREWIANLFSPGVVKAAKVGGSAGGDMAVTVVGGNMNINIATGVGLVYGFAYENDSTATKTIATQGGGLNRIDYVVLKLDFTAKTVLITVKQGTAASSPSAPALTQNSTTWEVPLCTVFVTNGAAALVSGNLTDQRAYCTAVVNPVMGAGSGLDADKLDGHSSNEFLLLTGGTLSGTITEQIKYLWSHASAAGPDILRATPTDGHRDLAIFYNGAGGDADGFGLYNYTLSQTMALFNSDGSASFTQGLKAHGSSTVWDASNDGAGSGLDADTVDGHQPGSGGGLDADTVDGVQAVGIVQTGSHNSFAPLKVSMGTSLPGSLDSHELFLLVAS